MLKVIFPFLYAMLFYSLFAIFSVFCSGSLLQRTCLPHSVITVILIYKNVEKKNLLSKAHVWPLHRGDSGDVLPFLTAASPENFLLGQLTRNNLLLLHIVNHQFCFCGAGVWSKHGNEKSA